MDSIRGKRKRPLSPDEVHERVVPTKAKASGAGGCSHNARSIVQRQTRSFSTRAVSEVDSDVSDGSETAESDQDDDWTAKKFKIFTRQGDLVNPEETNYIHVPPAAPKPRSLRGSRGRRRGASSNMARCRTTNPESSPDVLIQTNSMNAFMSSDGNLTNYYVTASNNELLLDPY